MNYYHGLYYLSFYVRPADSDEKWRRVYSLWDLEGLVAPPEGEPTLEEQVEITIYETVIEQLKAHGVKEDVVQMQIDMMDNNGGPLIDYSFFAATNHNPFDTVSLQFIVTDCGYDVLVRG